VPADSSILGSTGSTTFVLAALLVALGLAMIAAAVWLVRATRTDVPALGPLEVLGDRGFTRRDAEARAAALAAARPEGALGPAPMVPIDEPEREVGPAPAAASAPEPVAHDEVPEPAADPAPESALRPDPAPELAAGRPADPEPERTPDPLTAVAAEDCEADESADRAERAPQAS
jgi:hypothetical protein